MNLTILPLHDSIDWDVSPESRSASIVLLRPDLTDALAVHITVAQPAGRRDFVISVDSLDDGTPRVSWSCATTRDAFRTIAAYIAQRTHAVWTQFAYSHAAYAQRISHAATEAGWIATHESALHCLLDVGHEWRYYV